MTNIYLTPNFVETQRQKYDDGTIADFIATKVPDFSQGLRQARTQFGEESVGKYLDYKIYGTTEPQERFTQQVEQPMQQNEQGGSYLHGLRERFNDPTQGGITSGQVDLLSAPQQAGEFAEKALPAAGSILGGAAGAVAGIPGGPVGIAAGTVAGAAGGRALGEVGSQQLGTILRGEENIGESIGSALAGDSEGLREQGTEIGRQATIGAAEGVFDVATLRLLRVAKGLRAAKAGREALEQTAKETTGKIVQSTSEDIAKAQRALRNVDTQGVKTYDDLSNAINNKISPLANEVDDIYRSVDGVHTLDDLGTTIRSGKRTATQNYVEEALDGLTEMYQKTGDTQSMLQIQSLKDKALTEGLTPLEINDIAKIYGSEFGEKAFSKRTGEALTSVNAQRYENVRKGVKDTARSFLPNDAAKTLDHEVSDLIRTRELSQKMGEKVQNLMNKVDKRGIGEQIGRTLGKIIDLSTFGGFRGFMTAFVPSNAGLKSMNSLAIQKNLAKNLQLLDDVLTRIDGIPEEKAVKEVSEVLQSIYRTIQAGQRSLTVEE